MKQFIKIFIVLIFIFLTACSNSNISENTEILNSDIENEIVVGKDENFTNEIKIDLEYEKEAKKKEIEYRLKLKQERQKAFENITFSYEYVNNDEHMPYGLFVPSIEKYKNDLPLIIWLHGRGEVGCTPDAFAQRGGVGVLNEWSLQGFSAYILCPHLASDKYTGSWNNQYSRENLIELINYIKSNYNVNENKIYIMGHSLGAQGALYMVQKESLFKAVGLLSPYPPYTDIINTEIPIKSFIGTVVDGEDNNSIDYTLSTLSQYYGENTIQIVNASHGDVPNIVFNLDENEDNKSDFFEWLLVQ